MSRLPTARALIVASLAALASCAPTPREQLTPDQRVVPDPVLSGSTACAAPGTVADEYPCQCTSDCLDGATCSIESASGLPHGRCLRPCTVGGPAVCDASSVCAPAIGSSLAACRVACTGSSDVCPPNGACDALIHSCLVFCTADADCDSMHCNAYSGRCTDGTPATGGGVYAACLRNADCRSGLCSPTNHVCLVSCSVARQTCPDGAVCDTAQDNNDVGICYLPCDDPAATCPSGTACFAADAAIGHRTCQTQ